MKNRICNALVVLRDGESQEKLLRRFIKKCKKLEIIDEYLDKTFYHKTKRERRREKRVKNKRLKNKQKNE